jgi:hypothetical protein
MERVFRVMRNHCSKGLMSVAADRVTNEAVKGLVRAGLIERNLFNQIKLTKLGKMIPVYRVKYTKDDGTVRYCGDVSTFGRAHVWDLDAACLFTSKSTAQKYAKMTNPDWTGEVINV